MKWWKQSNKKKKKKKKQHKADACQQGGGEEEKKIEVWKKNKGKPYSRALIWGCGHLIPTSKKIIITLSGNCTVQTKKPWQQQVMRLSLDPTSLGYLEKDHNEPMG